MNDEEFFNYLSEILQNNIEKFVNKPLTKEMISIIKNEIYQTLLKLPQIYFDQIYLINIEFKDGKLEVCIGDKSAAEELCENIENRLFSHRSS